VRRGSRVRLRPLGPGDRLLDPRLAGRTATIDAIEQDCEGGFHFAVWLDGSQRLYFGPAEIEPLT
jgi:hypothetical protein